MERRARAVGGAQGSLGASAARGFRPELGVLGPGQQKGAERRELWMPGKKVAFIWSMRAGDLKSEVGTGEKSQRGGGGTEDPRENLSAVGWVFEEREREDPGIGRGTRSRTE